MKFEADTVEYSNFLKEFKSIADKYSGSSNVNYRILHIQGRKPVLVCTNSNDNVISEKEISETNDITAFFHQLFYSSLQKMMYNQIGNVFAFVVGFYDEDDKKINSIIDKAFSQFAKVSSSLDKKVDENIMKIVIPRSKRKEEEIVIRALGLNPDDFKPVVVVIYGRGRLTGMPLRSDEITVHNLLNQLVTLGTDCECGIDLSPLLQRAIPFVWTDDMNRDVFKMLDIDVENPMVLTEMSQILSKEPLETGKSDFSFAPQTIDLDAALKKNKISDEVVIADKAVEYSPLRVAIIVMGILLFLIIGVGLFLVKRNKR